MLTQEPQVYFPSTYLNLETKDPVRHRRHDVLDNGGTTSLGQKYAQAIVQQKRSTGLTHYYDPNSISSSVAATKRQQLFSSMDKVVSQDLEVKGILKLEADKLKEEEEWLAIMAAIKNETKVNGIRISSDSRERDVTEQDKISKKSNLYQPKNAATLAAKRAPSTLLLHSRITNTLSSSITSCLLLNKQITLLELTGFPLSEKGLYFLNKGLETNTSLTRLSLARTAMGDKGFKELVHGIRVHPQLIYLNFAACKLTSKSVSLLCDILKSQAIQRQAESWTHTLRIHRKKELEQSQLATRSLSTRPPIKRIDLCCNSIGNEGCTLLAETLREDIGLRALDVQMNHISDTGARALDEILRFNDDVVILDLRNNDIDDVLLRVIDIQLDKNIIQFMDKIYHQTWTQEQDPKSQLKLLDSDLGYLDGTDPLKTTYIHYPLDHHHRHHTQSSIKKISRVQPTLVKSKTVKSVSHSTSLQGSRSSLTRKPVTIPSIATRKPVSMPPTNSTTKKPSIHPTCHSIKKSTPLKPSLPKSARRSKSPTKKKTKKSKSKPNTKTPLNIKSIHDTIAKLPQIEWETMEKDATTDDMSYVQRAIRNMESEFKTAHSVEFGQAHRDEILKQELKNESTSDVLLKHPAELVEDRIWKQELEQQQSVPVIPESLYAKTETAQGVALDYFKASQDHYYKQQQQQQPKPLSQNNTLVPSAGPDTASQDHYYKQQQQQQQPKPLSQNNTLASDTPHIPGTLMPEKPAASPLVQPKVLDTEQKLESLLELFQSSLTTFHTLLDTLEKSK